MAYPSDPVCPRPSCGTYSSIEDYPEYCDRMVCDDFIPPIQPVDLTQADKDQQRVCAAVCSADRLGPQGTGK